MCSIGAQVTLDTGSAIAGGVHSIGDSSLRLRIGQAWICWQQRWEVLSGLPSLSDPSISCKCFCFQFLLNGSTIPITRPHFDILEKPSLGWHCNFSCLLYPASIFFPLKARPPPLLEEWYVFFPASYLYFCFFFLPSLNTSNNPLHHLLPPQVMFSCSHFLPAILIFIKSIESVLGC